MHKNRVEERKEEAKVRQAEAANRTPADRLRILDQRLGKGAGARRERAKLAALLNPPAEPEQKKGKKAKADVQAGQ